MIAMRRSPSFWLLLTLAAIPVLAGGHTYKAHASQAPGPDGLRSLTLSGPRGAETSVAGITRVDGARESFASPLPLFSLLVDGRPVTAPALPAGLALAVTAEEGFAPGAKLKVVFRNDAKSKMTLENLVPLGEGGDRAYITAGLPNEEPHALDRSQLSGPGSGRSVSSSRTTPGTWASVPSRPAAPRAP